MALGIANGGSAGTGDIMDRIEYDARAGRFFRVNRKQNGSGDWETEKEELRLPLTLVFDLENIEVGWIKFDGGPDFRVAKIGGNIGPRPEGVNAKGKPLYRQGFRLTVFSNNLLGGMRTFAHTAQCVISQMDMLHNTFVQQFPSNQGNVAVVTCSQVMSVKSGQSTNYAPVFMLDKWIPRPDGLKEPVPVPEVKATLSTVPATGSGHTPPPAAAPAVAASSAAEF